MIEWSGSIPLTNGSGSGSRRPKNIRIRNTDRYRTYIFLKISIYCPKYLTPMTLTRNTKQCRLALLRIKVFKKFRYSSLCKTWGWIRILAMKTFQFRYVAFIRNWLFSRPWEAQCYKIIWCFLFRCFSFRWFLSALQLLPVPVLYFTRIYLESILVFLNIKKSGTHRYCTYCCWGYFSFFLVYLFLNLFCCLAEFFFGTAGRKSFAFIVSFWPG